MLQTGDPTGKLSYSERSFFQNYLSRLQLKLASHFDIISPLSDEICTLLTARNILTGILEIRKSTHKIEKICLIF